jgi:hypothetical protein
LPKPFFNAVRFEGIEPSEPDLLQDSRSRPKASGRIKNQTGTGGKILREESKESGRADFSAFVICQKKPPTPR